MKKTIGLTYDLKEDWKAQAEDPTDASAEFDKPKTIQRVVEALQSGGHKVKKIGNIANLLDQINHLDVDIVFNLCEGVKGRNRESQVPNLLEMKGIPFVGADALTLGATLDKVVAKKLFISEGIPTPKFVVAKIPDDAQAAAELGFPLIVKTRHEGSSKGISEHSKVKDLESLRRQIKLINETYQQSALVEEFISGSEFTVAVLGNNDPKAMPVVQTSILGKMDLGEEFYTNERLYNNEVEYICPAEISSELTKQIQDLAVRVYNCVECRDFGRVDFRVDQKGDPYVLEINPLPSLDLEDVFNIFPVVLGSNYDETINQVIDFALERYGLLDEEKQDLQVEGLAK